MTVTFVALFIGIVLDILLNVYISRRMQYVTAIVIIMCLNLIPLYLDDGAGFVVCAYDACRCGYGDYI